MPQIKKGIDKILFLRYTINTENKENKEFFRIQEEVEMNLAKISANGQITVPAEIRKQLNLKSGDKILFFRNQSGDIVISNASAQALQRAQAAFAGAAEEMGVADEQGVQALVDEGRYGGKGV